MTVLQALTENARLTRSELCMLTGQTDSHNRDIIHHLRKKGVHIISDPHKKGYWIGSIEEWNQFVIRFNRVLLGSLMTRDFSNRRQVSFCGDMTPPGSTNTEMLV